MTSASTSSEIREPTGISPEGTMDPAAIHRQAIAELPIRELPAPAEEWILHGEVPADGQPVVLIHQTALAQIDAHSRSNMDCELGGALLGHAYRHNTGLIVEVKAALPALNADHGPVHFTFAADSWAQLQKDQAALFPHLNFIGWFHTHPDLGVFYSSDDVVVHSAAFTQPWHTGLVVDPWRAEASFFGWVAGGLAPLDGFYELPERQPESQVPWRAVRAAVWDRPYDSPAATGKLSQVVLARSGRPRFSGRELSWLTAAAALLLSFFLVVGAVLPLVRRVEVLETTVLNLAQGALANSNASTCPDPRLRIISPLEGQIITSGNPVQVIGTADYPDAPRYQVDVRAAGTSLWTPVNQFNRERQLDVLGEWATTGYQPGRYELRLVAVDRNNIRLATSEPCTIHIELTANETGQ